MEVARMTMKDRTKRMFADELERMVGEMPLSKVRVQELCRRCDTVPQTFYYHFHDKYELVAWMYLQDYGRAGTQTDTYSAETLERTNHAFEERRPFYRKCFNERVQNSIADYMFETSLKVAQNAMDAAGNQMTRRQELAVRYHCYGIVGMFGEWLKDDGSLTTSELSELLFERTPDFLKRAFDSTARV